MYDVLVVSTLLEILGVHKRLAQHDPCPAVRVSTLLEILGETSCHIGVVARNGRCFNPS